MARGDDLLVGGAGDDVLRGGTGINTLASGDGNDRIIIDTVNQQDTVIAATKGSHGQTDTLVLSGPFDVRATRESFMQEGADLVIKTRVGTWITDPGTYGEYGYEAGAEHFVETSSGKVIVKDFFVTRSGIDRFEIGNGSAMMVYTGDEIWNAMKQRYSDDGWWQFTTSASQPYPEGGRRTWTSGVSQYGAAPWTSIVNEYDAAGLLITQTTYNNNGTFVVVNGDAANEIYADQGGQTWRAGGGNDKLYGSTGSDFLYGDAGNDRLEGNEGDDRLAGGAGADTLIGDSGFDYASYEDSTAALVARLDLPNLRAFSSYSGSYPAALK